MVLPAGINVTNTTFPVSGINLLENSAQSWYDASYVNLRRRFAKGWTVLANYTFSKNLSDAPDFRSPMFESAAPQNNSNLSLEKGPACDVRHRFALSAVYSLPAWGSLVLFTGSQKIGVSQPFTRPKADSRSPSRCLAILRMPARCWARPNSRQIHGTASLWPRHSHG